MGSEQGVPEVVLDGGEWTLMGVSETLWVAPAPGTSNAAGCDLHRNDSEETRKRTVGVWLRRPKAFSTVGDEI